MILGNYFHSRPIHSLRYENVAVRHEASAPL